MKYQLDTLPNNLRVVTASMAEAMSTSISIFVGAGSRNEDFEVNGGVSHFLEHLMFKGTKKRPSTKIISEQIDAVGGYGNASTSNEMTGYYVKIPHQHTELGLDILADMLRNSIFDPTEIDRERGVIIEELNLYRDDPAAHVHHLIPALLWPGHPLQHEVIGSEEVIRLIKRQTIIDYQKSLYRPSNIVIAIAGKVDHEKAVKMVESFLGDIEDGEIPPVAPVKKELDQKLSAIEQKDTAQAHIEIATTAYPYKHPNDPAARLITTILGRGLSSRLYLNVRERKGLAYSISAHVDNFIDTGEFQVYAGANLEKVDEAIAAIVGELREIAAKPVGEQELSKAKNQIRGSLQMALENNSVVADRAGAQLLLLDEIRSVEETLADIDAVSREDVQRVAREMLAPERLRLGIISPNPEVSAEKFEKLIK